MRRVVVRHEVTRAEVDAEALAAWGRFVGRETPAPGWAASTRHVVVGLPAVGQRRALMAQLLCLKRHVRDVLPEVERVVSGFEAQWRRGEGEFDFTGEERRERGAFDGVGR